MSVDTAATKVEKAIEELINAFGELLVEVKKGEAPPPVIVLPPEPPPPPPPPAPTVPTQLVKPKVSATELKVGVPATRVVGTYVGTPIGGRRKRNGVIMPDANMAAWTPKASDVGASIVYEEYVDHNGKQEWVGISDPMVVKSDGVAPAPITPGRNVISRNGKTLLINGVAAPFLPGFNDNSPVGNDGNPSPTAAQFDAFCASMKPGTVWRVFGGPNIDFGLLNTMVRIAVARGLIVIICLSDGAGNEGAPQYNQAFYSGGYTGAYFTHVRKVVNNFKDIEGSVIFQSLNETGHRLFGGSITADMIAKFEQDTAALVKSISPNALTMCGIADSYHSHIQSMANYRKIISGSSIDIVDHHDYDSESVGLDGVAGRWNQHKTEAWALNKPIGCFEFGVGPKRGTAGRNDQQRADFTRTKLNAYKANGACGAAIWRLIYTGNPHGETGPATGEAINDYWNSPVASVIKSY